MKLHKPSHLFISLVLLGLLIGIGISMWSGGGTERVATIAEPKASGRSKRELEAEPDKALLESRRIASLTKTMQRARDFGLSLNGQMEFHGQVIDQFGNPVSGVSVKFDYIYYNAIVLATYEPHKAVEMGVSDKEGRILFTGKKGVTLTVTLEPIKGMRFDGGYWSHSFQTNNGPSAKIPPTSKDKPFIFYVYRLGNPVTLRTTFVEGYVAADKRTYGVSLSKEKLVERGTGDFDITVWQEGIEYKKGRSWGIDLHGTQLQFAPTDDPFLYWASIEGYQPAWNYSWSDDLKDYQDERNFRFWIKQGEFFGSLSVECVAFWKDKFRLIIRSSMNTKSGDPNLQPVLPDWPPKDIAIKK